MPDLRYMGKEIINTWAFIQENTIFSLFSLSHLRHILPSQVNRLHNLDYQPPAAVF